MNNNLNTFDREEIFKDIDKEIEDLTELAGKSRKEECSLGMWMKIDQLVNIIKLLRGAIKDDR